MSIYLTSWSILQNIDITLNVQGRLAFAHLHRHKRHNSRENGRFWRSRVTKIVITVLKVAEHSFGSLWVHVICQITAREGLHLTSWNLASEKYTDERFWLTGKIWHFHSFHGNMNNWFHFFSVYIKFAH